ncbi:MAG: hypothetical protein ACOX5Z_05950 [Desulfobulbus sp.]|jgi:hypothetical protein
MVEKKRLGELLLDAGLISDENLSKALRMQVGGNRRIGKILVQMNLITSDQLLEVLSSQFQLPIIDPEEEYSPSAQGILPRYLCCKYEVLPLDINNDNVLRVAMADPSDSAAIADIESFTGKAVQPCLARQADIHRAIKRHTRLSASDIFNPQSYTRYAKIASTLALIMVCLVAVFSYKAYVNAKYGATSQTETAVIYKNHDLMIGIDRTGKATLLGHGAYASGYYSISFDSKADLAQFLENKKNDLSSAQYEWTQWALSQQR